MYYFDYMYIMLRITIILYRTNPKESKPRLNDCIYVYLSIIHLDVHFIRKTREYSDDNFRVGGGGGV